MAWSSSHRPNRLLFWSLVVLAVVMVIAVAFALRGFNREMEERVMPPALESSNEDVTEVPLSDVLTEPILMGWNREENGLVSVAGTITSIFPVPERKDVNGASITLLVVPVVDSDIFPAPEKSYQFSVSESDTEGFPSNIAIGNRVTMYGVAEPSEEWSVLAKKIEKR